MISRFFFYIACTAVVVCGGVTALAADRADDSAAKAKSERLDALRQLPVNHAVSLGNAAVTGDFNDTARHYELHKTGPRGRDYSIKMVWAPDRQTALFCGANHGVPHRLNDVWEFDLTALQWRMLYAPDNARDYTGLGKDASDVRFKDGVLVSVRGGPAVVAHTWWGLTYDSDRKALLFMNTWVTNMKEAVQRVGGDPAELYAGPPLWAFYPETATWSPVKTAKPYPRAPFGGMLEHVPELGGTIWHANNWQMQETWLYKAGANTWTPLKPNGGGKAFEESSPQPEQIGYRDPRRKLLVVQRDTNTFHYDIQANTWKNVLARDKDATDIPRGHDAHAAMYHDPISGHGLLLEFKTNTLWAYNPDAVTWKRLTPQGDAMPQGGKRLAYMDPSRNVFVVIDGTKVWAYRYAGG
jgi:hypothetical protein